MNYLLDGRSLQPAECILQVKEADNSGAYMQAADYAETSLALLDDVLGDTDRITLQYYLVRSVVRSGAADRAANLFQKFHLAEQNDVDILALWPRILKEQALRLIGSKRKAMFYKAAEAYEGIYRRTGNYYPAVNAATLFRMSDQNDRSREMAQATFDAIDGEADSYWKSATLAEASIVSGNAAKAKEYIESAAQLRKPNAFAEVSTTLRQLKLLCRYAGMDLSVLDALKQPGVLFFAGHIISPPGMSGRFLASEEEKVATQISEFFDGNTIGFAFGSLASGADILIAEECIRRNIELHVALPFKKNDFIKFSVEPSGLNWIERFEHVFKHIEQKENFGQSSITYASDGAYLGDDSLFGYCSDLAMGQAIVRAQSLEADSQMLAIYDRKGGPGFGTNANLERWQELGLLASIISPKGDSEPKAEKASRIKEQQFPSRQPRALIFGDVTNFSKIDEELLPAFHCNFMKKLSNVLLCCGDNVLYSNSWGDAIFAVFEDPVTAARCSIEFQKEIKLIDFAGTGLPSDLSLRLSAHYGPVFQGTDYIRDEMTFFGSEVTRAARIEPITPPGEIYVTEAFASALVLQRQKEFQCDYMGKLSTAKNYGDMKLYVLRQTGLV